MSIRISNPLLLFLVVSLVSLIGTPVFQLNADTRSIQTIAGTLGWEGYGGDGGPAVNALLNSPEDIAVDSRGNLIIADTGNSLIRKVDVSTGLISTVGGTNNIGSAVGVGGLATNTYLLYPDTVAVDSAGNIYTSAEGLYAILKIDAITGIVYAVAGKLLEPGSTGDGVAATEALLSYVSDIEIDSTGNIYFSDRGNHVVRKIDSATGLISTIAGNIGLPGSSGDGGLATNARLGGPDGIALNSSGDVYIADTVNGKIRKVDAATGLISTVAGSGLNSGPMGDGGLATNARIPDPQGISIDPNGNMLIASLNMIRAVDASTGIINSIAGKFGTPDGYGDGGPASAAALDSVQEVTTDSLGNILIADSENHAIRKVNTQSVTNYAGIVGVFGYTGDDGLATAATLREPGGIAVDSYGNVFIADTGNKLVRKVDANSGIITTVAGNTGASEIGDGGPATSASLNYPTGIAVDSSGNIFIVETDASVIRKVDAVTGIINVVAGSYVGASYNGDGISATTALLNVPRDVAVDSVGNIYISDSGNYRVRKVDAVTGIISTIAGNGSPDYSGDDGLATNASLYSPTGIAVDSSGNVFIVDGNLLDVIRKVDAVTGIITTIAGGGDPDWDWGEGVLATTAKLLLPEGLAVDSQGNVFVADTGNNAIRRVDAVTGIISTVAGIIHAPDGSWLDLGTSMVGAFTYPSDVAVDSDGNIFVVDTYNHGIAQATSITVPDAPATVQATAGNSAATINWTSSASDGGSPIIYYTVVSNPGNLSVTTTSTSATISGLVNGISYTFSVTATNSFAASTYSESSNSVIPIIPYIVNVPVASGWALVALAAGIFIMMIVISRIKSGIIFK